ncbi:MAG: TolC family protein, partial [Pyrinomonadaceae bacterium]|nr:TolC family protein [Pyrinomonadaceae bacterium]
MPELDLTSGRYLDMVDGTSADEAVRLAIENNGEIRAMRDELEAAKALISQAELRPNPRLMISGTQEGIIGNRYSAGAAVSLPLELGGRRESRIKVAEVKARVQAARLANGERKLAAQVRNLFGESLARIEKLKFLEELLGNAEQGYKLIKAKVSEGSNAPLEQNMTLVELNRIRSMRETARGAVEIKMLALRNAIGLESVEPLRLKGNFENMLVGVPSLPIAKEQAVLNRPDLEALRHTLALGNAQLE